MKQPLRPFKLAFIGSHGVGKTTLCYGLAAQLKTTRCLSRRSSMKSPGRCPLPINRKNQRRGSVLDSSHPDRRRARPRSRSYPAVICDRSILDNYVYLLLVFGAAKRPMEERSCEVGWQTYDLLVSCADRCRTPVPEDGVRATDPSFQSAVDERLRQELEAYVPKARLPTASTRGSRLLALPGRARGPVSNRGVGLQT